MAKGWIFFASLLVALNCAADDDLTRGEWIIHWDKGREANRKKDYDTAARELSSGIELSKSHTLEADFNEPSCTTLE